MFNFFKLQDRTLKFLGREIMLGVHHQKKLLEGLPTIFGFSFDVATLHRSDELFSMIHQGLFLVLIFLLLFIENLPKEKLHRFKLWKYYDYTVQFLFGGLLSGYTIFYFKSASSIPVIIFALTLFGLMVMNESEKFHKSQFPVRYFLASLCLCSFLVYLLPIMFHWMNWISFMLSVTSSFLIYLWYISKLHKKQSWKEQPKRQRAIWGCSVPVLFAVLYFFKLIPPVPLSCTTLGVYHNVTKQADVYNLEYTRAWWRFWEHGDQTFAYRTGDRVYVFTSVFAPTDLRHKIQIRWEKYNEKFGNWETTDMIPIPIKGGREEGYRGFAYKQTVGQGDWRVRIETEDGRELRRLKFTVVPDENPQEERIVKIREG